MADRSARRQEAGSTTGGLGEEPDSRLPVEPTAEDGPDRRRRLGWHGWWGALRRTVREFQEDNLPDWAAALTYYGILSLFPGLLVLVSVLGMLGQDTTKALVDNLSTIAPGAVGDLLTGAIENLQKSAPGTASFFAIIGLAAALWSASGYVGAFMRAANAIYDVPEGRPIWKKLPTRLGVTVLTGVLLAATSLAVVFTGRLARQLGGTFGIGEGFVRIWDIAKWPVLVIIISLLFAVLYWASPNARPGSFRWITPGSLLAVAIWLIASGGFALYVFNFGSYNKTYGSIAGVIIFLVWLWISNIAVLLGAELDAELQRGRAIAAGHPPEQEPYVELRDTRKLESPAESRPEPPANGPAEHPANGPAEPPERPGR